MNNLKKEGGFTLIEIVVILAVIAIIAAAMVPRISGIMDDAKISRAQGEVQTIGMAILRFNANTGKWPARLADGTDNGLCTLVSGSADNKVQIPAYDTAAVIGTTNVNTDAASSKNEHNPFTQAVTEDDSDYFDNHLRANSPKGVTDTDKVYPTAGINRWNGPYSGLIGADPWGNAYVCNIVAAYNTDLTNDLYCYIVSAGPDGTIQTDANVTDGEVAAQTVGGDDVVFLVRARK